MAAPGLPGADVAAWISSWIWTLYVGHYALLGLLFPNGRLTSRRWRWVAWIGGSMVVTGAMLLAAMILAAIERSRSTSFSFWDALILEAALSASADRLLPEDLQHGQRIEDLTVVDPFLKDAQ